MLRIQRLKMVFRRFPGEIKRFAGARLVSRLKRTILTGDKLVSRLKRTILSGGRLASRLKSTYFTGAKLASRLKKLISLKQAGIQAKKNHFQRSQSGIQDNMILIH